MIQSRFLVPNYLTENSKDIHTFLHLIDLMVNNAKSKTDDFVNILNPDKCPNKLLPLLASYVGYDYDYNETYDGNRIIIRSYKDMIKNKGNTNGIQLATSIAISMEANKSLIDAQELIRVTFYDYYYRCPKCGYIAYEPFDTCPHCEFDGEIQKIDTDTIVIVVEYPLYSAKMYDLVEAVRPVGVNCLMYNGTIVNTEETVGLSDYIKLQSKFLNDGMSEVGGIDAVSGFTTILKEKPTEKYCEFCGLHINMYEKATEYQSNLQYYKYNYLNGEYVEIEIENEEDFNTVIKTTALYIINSSNICPKCGSQLFTENDSSLRLLYRLYTDFPNYSANVKSILENIIDGNTKNNSDCVGIILRINIDSDVNKTYIIDGIDHEVDWSCDFTQSFIFGLKPYINIEDNNKKLEYTIPGIFEKLARSNDKYNLQTLRDYSNSNFSAYEFVCGKPADEDGGNDSYDNTIFNTEDNRDYRIKAKTTDETEHDFYYKYTLKPNAGKIYKISNQPFKSAENTVFNPETIYYRMVIDYNIIEEYSDTIQSYYYIENNNYILDNTIIDEESFNISKSEHTNIYVKVYYINDYYTDVTINENNFNDNKENLFFKEDLELVGNIERNQYETSNGTTTEYSVTNTDDNKVSFKLGEDTQKLEPNDYHFDGLVVQDDSETLTDNNGKYIYVCRACNNVIGVTDENINTCPICGGIITSDSSKSSSQQFYDHMILQGSYLIDLYFGN